MHPHLHRLKIPISRPNDYLYLKLTPKKMSLSVKLNSGDNFPVIGLGTWKGVSNECEEFVYNAIKLGYRHIDTASIYQNEQEVGRGIARAIKDDLVTRKELFVVTKCWNDCHGCVEEACRKSLERLNLEYVDLYLIHWPVAWIQGTNTVDESANLDDTWRSMEKLVTSGLTKNIGVSNYTIAQMKHLLSIATIPPAVNQCESHLYFTNQALREFCLLNGVQFTAYSALFPRSDNYIYTPWRPIAEDPVINDVAQKHNKSPQQILLRWHIDAGTTVITKSSNPDRLQQNLDILNFSLDDEDMSRLSQLKQARYRNPHDFRLPSTEFFWKDGEE